MTEQDATLADGCFRCGWEGYAHVRMNLKISKGAGATPISCQSSSATARTTGACRCGDPYQKACSNAWHPLHVETHRLTAQTGVHRGADFMNVHIAIVPTITTLHKCGWRLSGNLRHRCLEFPCQSTRSYKRAPPCDPS